MRILLIVLKVPMVSAIKEVDCMGVPVWEYPYMGWVPIWDMDMYVWEYPPFLWAVQLYLKARKVNNNIIYLLYSILPILDSFQMK